MKRVTALLLSLGLMAAVWVWGGLAGPTALAPTPDPAPTPASTPEPTSTPAPEPAPTPEPEGWAAIPADYDYSQTVPASEPVGTDYFADAAFVGDSRVDGFRLYSGLTQGEFIVKTGMNVFRLDTDRVNYRGESLSVLEALGKQQYGKIYLSLGLNELGERDDQGYYDHYAKLVDAVRSQQPQALVYIQLITPVNAKKCAAKKQPSYVNNEQIGIYNGLLRQLAQDKQVLLLDPAEALTDETGQPPYDTVTDGIHFTKATYKLWLEYLKCHAI